MSRTKLKYLDVSTLESLKDSVSKSLDRYRTNGFVDLATSKGWGIEKNIEIDASYFQLLSGEKKTSEADANNSILVWKALHNLTPALATENRIWTRLSHIECFEYSKTRWLDTTKNDEKLIQSIMSHFFAPSLTLYRDDHSIGRLWWNAFVAIKLRPDNYESALSLICLKADIRQALMERSLSFSRVNLGQGLLRAMERVSEIYEKEINFREFMKAVNVQGGGIVFEYMSADKIDKFLDHCWRSAEKHI